MSNRKHSKIDALPTDIKSAVEEMILGNYTYRDVCNFVRDTANVTLSEAAVCRYAQGLNATVQDLRLASENMRTLTEEMAKYPKLIDRCTGLIRAIAYKNENDTRVKNLKDVAFESFKEEIFDAMAKEAPELYKQLVQFITARKDVE